MIGQHSSIGSGESTGIVFGQFNSTWLGSDDRREITPDTILIGAHRFSQCLKDGTKRFE